MKSVSFKNLLLLIIDDTQIKMTAIYACVAVTDAGDIFGEMSLLNGVEWRVASVITDDPCQLLVVSQRMFERYIKRHVSEMYSEKSRFVLTNPYLKSAPSAFKTSLIILMRKKSFGYDEVLVRQGQQIDSVYFILRSANQCILNIMSSSVTFAIRSV